MTAYTEFFKDASFPNMLLYTAAGAGVAFVTGHAVVAGAAFGMISEIFSQCTKALAEQKIKNPAARQCIRFVGTCAVSTLSISGLATAGLLRNPITLATGFTFACGIALADFAWQWINKK
ncbi:MAG: hypothetical protein WC222_11125 [Parachlamydiales bacterium]|jgi:hypothetical protein